MEEEPDLPSDPRPGRRLREKAPARSPELEERRERNEEEKQRRAERKPRRSSAKD